MTTGVHPFAAETAPGVIDGILHRKPASPKTLRPDIPPVLESAILKSLEKDPGRRYASAAQMGRELDLAAPPGMPYRGVRPTRRLAKVLGVTALAALAGLAVWKGRDVLGVLPGAPRMHAVAVLPLENLSGDKTQEYFAEGMTDALTTQLAQIGSLRVISRTSSAAARAAGGGTRAIARRLQVDALVEARCALRRSSAHLGQAH